METQTLQSSKLEREWREKKSFIRLAPIFADLPRHQNTDKRLMDQTHRININTRPLPLNFLLL